MAPEIHSDVFFFFRGGGGGGGGGGGRCFSVPWITSLREGRCFFFFSALVRPLGSQK